MVVNADCLLGVAADDRAVPTISTNGQLWLVNQLLRVKPASSYPRVKATKQTHPPKPSKISPDAGASHETTRR